MYLPVALTIKTAFLLFFSRIFAVNNAMKTKWLIYGAIVANAIFYIALIFDTIFFCTPIEKSWNPEIPGHCGNSNAAPIASGVWASLSDFYILILPIYCVWNLQLKRAQKWRLSLVFGFGLLYELPYSFIFFELNAEQTFSLNRACTASVIRFVYTITLADSPDVTWSLAILSLWRYEFSTEFHFPSYPAVSALILIPCLSQYFGNLCRLYLLLSPSLPSFLRTHFSKWPWHQLLLLSFLVTPVPEGGLHREYQFFLCAIS